MAITLDELLGKNVQTVDKQDSKQFPSYEEFKKRNTVLKTDTLQNAGFSYYNPQEHMYSNTNVVSNDTKAYIAPQKNEFVGNYDRFDENMNFIRQMDLQNSYGTEMKPTSLYDYCRKDNDRLSEQELQAKLSYSTSNPKAGIVFSDAAASTNTLRFGLEKTKQNDSVKSVSKSHGKLNKKGKIILAIYGAVVLVSAILIIVNAKKINIGENLVPSASVENYSISQEFNK